MTIAGKIPLTKMYAKTSSRTGEVYYVGRLAAARVLLFKAREQPDEGDPVYELLLEAVEGDQPAGRSPRPQGHQRKGNVVDALRRLGRDLENAEADRQPQEKAVAKIVDDDIPDFAR